MLKDSPFPELFRTYLLTMAWCVLLIIIALYR